MTTKLAPSHHRFITFYVHPNHHRRVKAAARKHKLSLSAYVRNLILHDIGLDASEDYRHIKRRRAVR
jgi:hypothetical protein